jgi:outer membrane lipoprotein-sorting protein
MKKIIFSLLIICSHVNTYAQPVEAIIDKHIIARGGAALDSIKNAKMDIELSYKNAPTMKQTMTYHTLMRAAHRIDISIPNMYDAVICFNGNQGWQSVKKGDESPKVKLIDSSEVQDLKYQTEILGPLYQYKEKGYKVEYLGKEKVNDIETYNIKVKAINNTMYNCYIDTITYAEIKRTVTAPSSGQIITVELYYSNIKPVSGVMMPFRIEMLNKRGVTYFDFKNIILNATIENKLFDAPSS